MKYRCALIGFGNAAVAGHLLAWRQNRSFTLCAVVDPLPERLRLARALLPGVACYRRVEELFAHERIDCVDICTPPLTHDALLLEACRRRVHILCEKPLTLSQSTFRSLHSYTLQHGRVVFTVHNWQYAPLFQALKAALVTGVVGMPEYLEFITLRARPAGLTSARVDSWRLDRQVAGGGILVDHGWHVFYLAPFLLGREPRAIAVRLERCRRAADSVEDTATGVIECSGARARFYLTWAAERRSNMGLVRGPAGMIRFDAAALRIEQPSKPVREQHFAEALTASSYHPEWFAPLLDDFQREIEDPRVRGRNLQAAALCLALTIRGYESYQQGGALLLL